MSLPLQELAFAGHADRFSGAMQTLQSYLTGRTRLGFAARSAQDTGEYVAALGFLCGALQAMTQEITDLRSREETSRRRIAQFDEQIEAAAAIQRDLLPVRMPDIRGLDVHTLFRPMEALSGDWYDVFRIDETHVGFALADAVGHGIPGGILSTFLSRSFRNVQLTSNARHSPSPDQVLGNINQYLLDADFGDSSFVSALFACYHEPTRTLTWARGGAPYPILIPRSGASVQIKSNGPLIGAIDKPKFDVARLTLQPGDIVVFHTDGLEALLSDRQVLSACPANGDSPWFSRLCESSMNQQLEDLDRRLAEIGASTWRRDDVTVVALQTREN